MAKKLRKGATIVKIELSIYVKDRIDEILATGDFRDINEFIQHAALYAIAGYKSFKNERLLKELNELRTNEFRRKMALKANRE